MVRLTLSLPLFDTHPQAHGALFTYARRYMLNGLLNIAAEQDGDGQVLSPKGSSTRSYDSPESRRRPLRDGNAIEDSAEESTLLSLPSVGSTPSERGDRMPDVRSRRRSNRNPLRTLASHLCRHFGARTPEEFSLVITTACDDPLMTWNVVRSRSDLVDEIIHQIEVWRVRQGWSKEEVLPQLKNLRSCHVVRGTTTEDNLHAGAASMLAR